jgi:nicotinate-nucleotide adenylyltransferase
VSGPRLALGLMGGTFDPIHFGHLVAAEAVRHQLSLDRVIFIPAGSPPHKRGRQVSDAPHRLLMAVLATVTNPYFEVSRIEVDRPGPSYTADTVAHFRAELGEEPELYFITGLDAVREILSWHDHRRFLSLCRVVAVTRPGYRRGELQDLERVLADTQGSLEVIEVPALAISSSDIRRRVEAGAPIKYLVPEAVEHYILKSGLYRSGQARPPAVGGR